jgi:predicted transcriptional regulator
MFKEALDGNITMQIWLSKQHLDMKEKREDKTEITAVTKKEIEDKRLELLEGQIFGLLNDNRAIDVIETVATHIPSNDK